MMYQYPDACLVIFAKAPVAGKVKTRLIPALGAEGACQLYQRMANSIIVSLVNSAVCQVNVFAYPDVKHAFFKDLKNSNVLKINSQYGNDLGDRMLQAITNTHKKFLKVILIGTDCPDYSAAYIESAIKALDNNDVVIGPATDGGYVLIGTKTPEAHIFSHINWGENTVLNETIQRIREASLTYQLLPPLHDIDIPSDLKHLK